MSRSGNVAGARSARGAAAEPPDGSRIPAWRRYGVRVAEASSPSPSPSPSPRHAHPDGADCCCGVVQLLGASRIPLPAEKPPAINRRGGIFSRINSGEAARAAPVCEQQRLVWSPARRRILVRPKPDLPAYLKLCSSPPPDETDTLDRLQKFRFGGGGDRSKKTPSAAQGHKKKPPRSTDKTERLRELTEKLKGRPGPAPPTDHEQRTTPVRSASFSRVEFSPMDGKYVRAPATPVVATGGSLTPPRKRPPAEEAGGSTPSVDSAVGSDEGFVGPHKPPGSRSLTYPLPRRGSRSDEDLPFTSIDGNGLKSLLYAPANRELREVAEEGDGSDARPASPGAEMCRDSGICSAHEDFAQPSVPDDAEPDPEATATPADREVSSQRPDEPVGGVPEDPEWNRDDGVVRRLQCQSSEEREDESEGEAPRRYSKRPLRGPYGQMLEAEMKKPEADRILSKLQDLKFLEEYAAPPAGESPRPRALTTQSLDDSQLKGGYGRTQTPTPHPRASPKRKVSAFVCHQRTTSSPSQLEGYSGPSSGRPELLAELLRGSSERLFVPSPTTGTSLQHSKDTRTHVVVELFETERSYVESLQTLVEKYLKPLKSQENAGLVDAALVDEIFYQEEVLQIFGGICLLQGSGYTGSVLPQEVGKRLRKFAELPPVLNGDAGLQFQVPAILKHHESFLEDLRKRLDTWDIKQTVGDIFLGTFTQQPVLETYTSFINNWRTAKEAIKSTCQSKPAFARFLEAMAREHKGKLALDSLLIMPVQRIPRYELLIQTLLKHTDPHHPDHQLLLEAQREVHGLALKINCTERESLELEQQHQALKELEALIEGLVHLVATDRTFIRHDLVTMVSGQGTRKERALFLFSDLLIITSIKRRSGTIRKPSTSCAGSVASTLEANKYKLLMRIPLDDLEIVKAKDESVRQIQREIESLSEDVATLSQIAELTSSLHCPHASLEELVREMLSSVNRQLTERQGCDSQLSYLELTVHTQTGVENLSVMFTKPEKKNRWEECFNETKQKLALSADRRPSPEFVAPLPIRKTRAGLQFTCAAPTLGMNVRDVWVCNSDGYVGQVCVLSLNPEPTVISCNGVCNARILCVASIPAAISGSSSFTSGQCDLTSVKSGISISVEDTDGGGNIQLDSSSSSDDEDQGDDSFGHISSIDDEQKRIRSASDSIINESAAALDDSDSMQPTMWLGTEDGCIHVYNSSDNIRIKKNKVKIQHGSSVHCIIYLDNRVFVSLANGDITVYLRDQHGGWNTADHHTISVGTAATPVTRMLPIAGKLWCGCHNTIKILNTSSLKIETCFQVNADSTRAVTCLAVSGFGVWISLQNSAVIRLFNASTYECLCDVNVAPAVTKMLASCDDIIRQHKAACLRVTSLLACKDLLWIGTSAGVLLTMPLPHVTSSTSKLAVVPSATGVPHGHTGHVRFLTCVETQVPGKDTLRMRSNSHRRYSFKMKPELQGSNANKLLVISGGDGYEDFRTSSLSEVAGREDSTNHLLLWHM